MSKIDKKKENGRVVQFLLFPCIFIFAFLTVVMFQYFGLPGMIGLILSLVSLVFYYLPAYQEKLLGIKTKTIFISLVSGVGFSIVFWILNQLSPAFSIGFPNLSLAISKDVRFILIVVLFPICEEIFFRSVLLGGLMEVYKMKEGVANVLQSLAFAIFHLAAYGLALGAYSRWIEAFSAFNAILGLFLAAGFMGFLWGYISRRDGIKNILFNIISHSAINAILFTAAVVYF